MCSQAQQLRLRAPELAEGELVDPQPLKTPRFSEGQGGELFSRSECIPRALEISQTWDTQLGSIMEKAERVKCHFPGMGSCWHRITGVF